MGDIEEGQLSPTSKEKRPLNTNRGAKLVQLPLLEMHANITSDELYIL